MPTTVQPLPRSLLRQSRLALVMGALAVTLSACSDDDSPPPAPTATSTSTPQSTSTSTPQSTSTASPTETPTPPPHAHDELVFGSTESGGGALQIEFDGDHQHADFDTCLGGEGDECIGGIAVFSSDAPGFEHTEEDVPDESLYRLDDGTTVLVEIVDIDEGFSLRKDGFTADAPGETLELGTVPELEHTHVDYTIAVPGGTEGWTKSVTLRLITMDGSYPPSAPQTLEFREAHG